MNGEQETGLPEIDYARLAESALTHFKKDRQGNHQPDLYGSRMLSELWGFVHIDDETYIKPYENEHIPVLVAALLIIKNKQYSWVVQVTGSMVPVANPELLKDCTPEFAASVNIYMALAMEYFKRYVQ